MNEKSLETLEAVVQRARPNQVWLYRKPDSLWTILQVALNTSGQKCVAKGVVKFEPRHGDRLKLFGTWTRSDFNGAMEFSFARAEMMIPTEPRAALEYAATITSGIGPAKMQEIWDAYGADWASHPDLEGIAGIFGTTISNWGETLRRLLLEQAKTAAITFLLSKCCTMSVALKAWEEWTDDAVGKVNADPYCLMELPRVGFLTVENMGVAKALGVEESDPRRMRAAVRYAMGELTSRIGTLIEVGHLLESPTLAALADAALDAVQALEVSGDLVRIGDAVSIKADYDAEFSIFQWVAA